MYLTRNSAEYFLMELNPRRTHLRQIFRKKYRWGTANNRVEFSLQKLGLQISGIPSTLFCMPATCCQTARDNRFDWTLQTAQMVQWVPPPKTSDRVSFPPRSCSVLMDGCNESGSAWFATNAALTTTVDECSMEQSMQPEMGARRPPVTLLT